MRHQRLLVAGLHLITLLLLSLHLYVRTLPPTATPIPTPADAEAAWWGLWPVTYAPAWTVILAVVLISGWIVGWWIAEMWNNSKLIENRRTRNTQHATRNTNHSILLFIITLLFIAFYAFPIVHTRWGDAYLLAKAIAWPEPALRLTHSWQAPLDVFLHSQLWLRFHGAFGWEDAVPVYRLLSPVAGLLYLLIALAAAREQEAATPTWLTFGLVTSIGVLQLFFGYVENYSFAAAGILLYLWLGLRTVAGRTPLWVTATALALTHAFHPSTIILVPSLLYCGWRQLHREAAQTRKGNKLGARHVLLPALSTKLSTGLAIVLPMAVVGLAVIKLMEAGGHGVATLMSSDRPGGGDARLFVPLWQTTTRWEHYTMFSWLHLRDFLNEQLLVAPVVLPGLAIASLAWLVESVSRQHLKNDPAHNIQEAQTNNQKSKIKNQKSNFLLLASVCYLLFIWVWNPDYGGQRDWDLFSLAAIPAALLLAISLPSHFVDQHDWQAGAIPLLMLQWLHLAAWVYQNMLPWEWPS